MFSRFQRLDRYSDLIAALAALVLVAALAANSAGPSANHDWQAQSPVQTAQPLKA